MTKIFQKLDNNLSKISQVFQKFDVKLSKNRQTLQKVYKYKQYFDFKDNEKFKQKSSWKFEIF